MTKEEGEREMKILVEDYNGVGTHLYQCEKCGFIALYHEGTEPKICPKCEWKEEQEND